MSKFTEICLLLNWLFERLVTDFALQQGSLVNNKHFEVSFKTFSVAKKEKSKSKQVKRATLQI